MKELIDTEFNSQEIRRLTKCFKKMDTDNSGTLSKQEFMAIPDIKKNILAQRMIDILDVENTGEITLKQFIDGISQFRANEYHMIKFKFLFRIYDLDNDDFIKNSDLFNVLKMVIENISNVNLQQIVDKTFVSIKKGPEDKINFDEFLKLIDKRGFKYCRKMIVDV